MNRIKRARGINGAMTGIFYLIAVFFFVLRILGEFCLLCASGQRHHAHGSNQISLSVHLIFCTKQIVVKIQTNFR